MKLKVNNKKIIDVNDWDELVKNTYKKPYNFQQQDGCQERCMFDITIPCNSDECKFPTQIPLNIGSDKMGIDFEVWLKTDPKDHQKETNWSDWEVIMFWERNFYPSINVIANDLYERKLIDGDDYSIEIDW